MKISTLLFCALIFIVACNSNTEKQTSNAAQTDSKDSAGVDGNGTTDSSASATFGDELLLDNYLAQNKPDTSGVQVIDSATALIVYPTDEQVDQMMKQYGEDSFYTVADDAVFYQGTAMHLIDSAQVSTTNATKRYVKFVDESETWTLDIRKSNAPPWNIIFFKPGKKPEIVSAIDLDLQKIQQYFER